MAELKCIAESPNPTDPAIIFIHGLDGHASQTWMADNTDEKTLWPKWLAEDFNCSVFLMAYDASLSKWKDSAMPLPDQGDATLHAFCDEPKLKGRPLILVGHSMGGLVIKTAIQNGLSKGVARFKEMVNQIRGVVFVGTPHNGAQLATLATYAAVFLRTNTQVKNMQMHDAHLRALNAQFLAYYNDPPAGKVSALTFTETQGVFVGKRILGIRVGPTVTIVGPNDGNAHVRGEVPVPLAENHISMCKLSNKNQPLYKSLLRFLREDVDLALSSVASEVDGSVGKELPNETEKVAEETPEKPQPTITTGNITAGDGGVAVGVSHGSITITNNRP